jgi:isopenicillin-N epimerase
MKAKFLLDPDIVYLNHGSFGACPSAIFDDYQKWQRELEREPVQFITANAPRYLKTSKEALGRYINANPKDFFFVPNPTFAVNAIMRSLGLKSGDEILATNHEYGAMDRTWRFFESKSGVRYVRQNISTPIVSKDQIIAEFWEGYSHRTKVVFLNQVSSATALIFPVMEICAEAKRRGLITIVDGAHVPGHIALDLQDLEADFYTGTMHKWLLTPKGSSFLYVRKPYQDLLDPLVVSWGYEGHAGSENRFLEWHEQQGTRDISAFLTMPAALAFRAENNWDARTESCKSMILEAYPRFCELLQTDPICPVSPEFLGQMCSIPIQTPDAAALKSRLFDKYKIEIPVMQTDVQHYIRISLNGYNTAQDLDALYEALNDTIAMTDLLQVGQKSRAR